MESFRADIFELVTGSQPTFAQDNVVNTHNKHTVRGLHYQAPPKAQGKLVTCLKGQILDVAVDARKNSPTYGQNITAILSAETRQSFWVPEGFLHGYLTLTDNCEVQYKVSEFYAPQSEGAVQWNDPDLNIDWGVNSAILSEKDKAAQSFAAFDTPF